MGQGQSSSFPLILSYLTLRRIIGWIAVLLPLVLVAARLFLHKQLNIPIQWPDSASGFYYTGMRDVFVGSVCALGVFLLAYRGHDRVDFWITFAAGVCAIGVALFPTKPSCKPPPECVTPNQNLVGNIHNGFAITLITLMGFMALRFAKSAYQDIQGNQSILKRSLRGLGFANKWPTGGEQRRNGTPRPSPSVRLKRRRNWWYRTTATVTLFCATLFLLQGVTPWLDWFKDHIRVFLLVIETIAIFSFGAAWFVKGRSLLPLHRKQLLRNQRLTSVKTVGQREVAKVLAEGKSISQAAKEIGITRQLVSEIAAEIT